MRPAACFVPIISLLAACTLDHHDHDTCDDESHDPAQYSSLAQAVTTPDTFTFVTLDIGQGDSAIVVAPGGCAALLDGGPTGAGATIKANLRSLGITRLDFAIVSHYHADHMGGIDEVEQGTDGISIAKVYDRGGSYASVAYDQYAAQFSGRRVQATRGMTFSLCNQVQFTVVAANGNGVTTSDENAKSVVVKASYNNVDALVGGDLTGSPNIEQTLLADVGPVEIYKVHHHGSSYSTTQALVDALQPTVSLISCSWNNSYGHPAASTVERLTTAGTQIWQTEDPATATKRGHITVSSADGLSFSVAQGATTAQHQAKPQPDTTPPTAPGNVVATPISPSQIDLAWSPAADAVGVVGYRVFRGITGEQTTVQIAETTATAWSDGSLAASTSYSYVVRAFDMAGNVSIASETAAVRTLDPPDTLPPSTPTNLTTQATSTSQIDLAWVTSTDDVGVAGYRVQRDGVHIAETTNTTWADTALSASTTYTYTVSAFDAAGNVSPISAPASARTADPPVAADTTAPSTPGSLTVQASSTSRIDLAWTSSTDDVGVAGYKIYRAVEGGALAFLVETAGTAWSDTGLQASTTYSYAVRAVDAAGNESAATAQLAARTANPACTVSVTALEWHAGKRELTVRAAASVATTASLYADSVFLTSSTSSDGLFQWKRRLAARPACVTVTTSCGGSASRCF